MREGGRERESERVRERNIIFLVSHSPALPLPHSLIPTPLFLTCFYAFDPPRLVYHALEEAADCLGV